MHRAQVVLINNSSHSPAQVRACILVRPEMDSAVNARIGDIMRDLAERAVLQCDCWYGGVRERNGMSSFAVNPSQHLGSGIPSAPMV